METRSADGTVVERARMRGEVLDGLTVTCRNGRPAARMAYRMGRLHGPACLFDEAGRPAWKAAYRAGLLHGQAVTFAGGREVECASWAGGVREGTTVTFHPGGAPASRVPHRAGLPDGQAAFFAEDGALLRTVRYAAGVQEGETVEYRPRGAPRTRAEYRGGTIRTLLEYGDDGDGVRKTWFSEGVPLSTIECRATPPLPSSGPPRPDQDRAVPASPVTGPVSAPEGADPRSLSPAREP